MLIKRVLTAVVFLFTSVSIFGVNLIGAGATFPYPFYSKVFSEYHKAFDTKVNYQAIGSGGGIRQLLNKTVNFGATDAFIKDKQLKKYKTSILHVPTCLGSVSIAFNVPGVKSLKLSSDVLANIYMGKIKKWNDPRIATLNTDVKLPKLSIAVIRRSDSSGTSFIFTDYLAKVSQEWAKKIGVGKAVNWPVGLGGKGNSGVAGLVQNVPGSIGYIEMVYAKQNDMSVASIQNKSGHFVKPNVESTTLAADVDVPDDTRISITDTPAEFGYPISGFTWLIVYKELAESKQTEAESKETVSLIKWVITEGQQYAEELGYAPLPKSVQKKALSLVNTATYNGDLLLGQ